MDEQRDETGREQHGTTRVLLRKSAVAVAGGAVTAAGLVMLVTPGPGIIVTMAGLGILGREFPAARRRLNGLRRWRQPNPGDETRDA